jgi:arylsulfatase
MGRQQKALMPDKPFFMYFAPGATHAPHHVPKEWSDKYKGRFDQGWDALREEIFARQKELGVIPPDAELTERHDEIPAWDDMPEELKPVLARQMEVYAGFLEHTDHHVGRLVDALEDLGVLEDTLIYYIIGDNGASAEGTVNGTFNEMFSLNGAAALETADFVVARVDEFGTPTAYNHYAVGWAHAMDTPYQWTKQVASHWGGTRNGTIVHWPHGFEARGEIRSQFHHVIDVAPTVLEAAGLPQPTSVDGVEQHPIEGTSMVYSFDDATEAERRETQYFEMFCNRGIYHDGWTAVTRHSIPWVMGSSLPSFQDDLWELYEPGDWSQAHDRAAEMPEKLAELQALWLAEAKKYNVLPLDDRRVERFDAGSPADRCSCGATRSSSSADGPLEREQRLERQEQVARRHGRGRRPRERSPRASSSPRAVRSPAGVSTPRPGSRRTATTCSACSASRSRATPRSRPERTRCAWSSPTTEAGLQGRERHALRRRRPGGLRAASRAPYR